MTKTIIVSVVLPGPGDSGLFLNRQQAHVCNIYRYCPVVIGLPHVFLLSAYSETPSEWNWVSNPITVLNPIMEPEPYIQNCSAIKVSGIIIQWLCIYIRVYLNLCPGVFRFKMDPLWQHHLHVGAHEIIASPWHTLGIRSCRTFCSDLAW